MTNHELMTVSKLSETSERILRMVAERRRNTVYTAFSGLRADLKKRDKKEVDRKDFDETFRRLAKIGAGKLECSRRGVCQGFTWSMPIRQIGAMFDNKPSEKKSLEKKPVESKSELNAAIEKVAAAQAGKKISTKTSEKSKAGIKKAIVVVIRPGQTPETFHVNENRLKQL